MNSFFKLLVRNAPFVARPVLLRLLIYAVTVGLLCLFYYLWLASEGDRFPSNYSGYLLLFAFFMILINVNYFLFRFSVLITIATVIGEAFGMMLLLFCTAYLASVALGLMIMLFYTWPFIVFIVHSIYCEYIYGFRRDKDSILNKQG
jgi:hypothetical protein